MRRNKEFTIGIAVATLFVVLVWLVLMFGKQSFPTLGEEYTITAKFDQAPGIDKNTPVNMNGIRIGRVVSTNLVDDVGKRYVEVKLQIRKDNKIYTSDECRISSMLLSLGGNISLEIARNDKYKGPAVELKDGDEIKGAVQSDFMQSIGNLEGELTGALQNISDTAKKIEVFIDSINAAVGTPAEAQEKNRKFQEIISKSGEMMDEFHRLAGNVNEILGDPDIHDNIRSVAKELPDTLQQVRNSLDNFNTFSRESRITLNRVSKTFDKAELNLDQLQNFTEALGEEGPDILRSVSKTSKRLDGLFNDISSLMSALNNPDGSLGQLLENPDLYNNIQQTIANVEEMSETLKPIVSDFRVFSDKIARDPGVLGVRGVISPGSPLKGLPLGRTLDCEGSLHRGSLAQYGPATGIVQASHNTLFSGLTGSSQAGCLSFDTSDPELEMIQRQNLVQRALHNASQRQQSQGMSMQYGNQVRVNPLRHQSCLDGLFPKISFDQPEYDDCTEIIGDDQYYGEGYYPPEGCVTDGFAPDSGVMDGNIVYEGMDGTGFTEGNIVFDPNTQGGIVRQPAPTPSMSAPSPQIGSQYAAPPRPAVAPVPALTVPKPTQNPLLPTTILEFGPVEDSSDPSDKGANMNTYPTGDRGYVLEFETTLPQQSPEVQLAQAEPQPADAPQPATVSQPAEELDRSAYSPKIITPTPLPIQTQPQSPPAQPEPQYGSVRRNLAR